MKSFQVELSKEYPVKGGVLDCLLASRSFGDETTDFKRPAIVVVPGGGYRHVSPREGEPIAMEFLARGFHAFVLNYTVGGEGGESYPEQLLQLGAAVDYVKKNAKEFCVNENEIFVVGFSAGGHLTANLAVEYASVSQKMGKEVDCKPTAIGLGYPVISKINGHQGSFNNLLYGYTEEEQEELLKTLNLNESVTENTPPAFIWTMARDNVVPSDNSLRFAQALYNNGVLYELHVYPYGGHGSSTLKAEINGGDVPPHYRRVSRWLDDCAEFFRLFTEEKF